MVIHTRLWANLRPLLGVRAEVLVRAQVPNGAAHVLVAVSGGSLPAININGSNAQIATFRIGAGSVKL